MERSYQALYYPFIHFRDEGWIKSMSLYWEGVSRIVPQGYVTRDGEDVRALAEVGVVSDVAPDPRTVGDATSVLSDVLDEREPELVDRYGLHCMDSWPEDATTATWGGPHADTRLAYLHVDKLLYEVADRLDQAGLAQRSRGGDGHWIGMHPRIVDAYMVALADALAVRHSAHPLTDDFTAHYAVADGRGIDRDRFTRAVFDLEVAQRGPRDAEEMLVAVAFHEELPDLRQVPVDRVLELRRRTEEARLRFQDGVAALVAAEAFEGAGPDAVRREVERIYRRYVVPSVAAYREEAGRLSIDAATSLLSVKTTLPLAGPVTGAAHVTDGPLVWAIGALAVAVGVIQASVATRRARRKLRTSEPVGAYLADLRSALPPKQLVPLVVG